MKKSILILDDDIIFVKMLMEFLEVFGEGEVKLVAEGVISSGQAIDLSKKKKYDFLILDYLIDQTNGKEVIKRIREFDKDIKIILLTGHSDYINETGALKEMDIQLYIEKSPLVLGEIVEEIMKLADQ